MSRFDADGDGDSDGDGDADGIPLFILRQARNVSTSSLLEYIVIALSHPTCPMVSSLKQFSRFASVSSLTD